MEKFHNNIQLKWILSAWLSFISLIAHVHVTEYQVKAHARQKVYIDFLNSGSDYWNTHNWNSLLKVAVWTCAFLLWNFHNEWIINSLIIKWYDENIELIWMSNIWFRPSRASQCREIAFECYFNFQETFVLIWTRWTRWLYEIFMNFNLSIFTDEW